MGLSEDELNEYSFEFIKATKGEDTGIAKQVKELQLEINIFSSSYLVLVNGYNEDIAKMLKNHNINVDKDNLQDGLAEIQKKLKSLHKRVQMLSTNLPTKPKTEEDINGYDILANLFTGLEFAVPFDSVSVGEYISYQKTLKKKSESIKKAKNGRRASKN